MISSVFVLHLSFFIAVSLGSSNCPNDICDAVYDNSLAVLRADDGDIIYPAEGQSCSDYHAVCMGDSCHACKCPLAKDTFDNHDERCENFDSKAKIVYSRGGLTVNTTVSTVYFAKNADSMYELRSVATGTELPLVAPNGSSIDWIVNCTFNRMRISTMHDNWEEVSYDGYKLTAQNGKGFLLVNPSSIKIQPEHLQGQLVEIRFKCPSSKYLFFKVQGRSVNLDNCLDCDGNFGHLTHLAIPDFPKPAGPSDSPINLGANVLQYKGKDVSGCNPDNSEDPYASYYNPATCSSLEVPGDNILYASGTSIKGRNFANQNAIHWDTITGSIIKMYVTCSNNKDFCVLFRLSNSSSICSGNPCMNGGKWVQNGLSSCVCQCANGFNGEDCSIGESCDDSPCCDGATCTNNGNSYTCTCPVGKTGSTCCDTDYCASNPCSEGATCTNDYDALSYSCACPPGKTGQTCNDFIDYCANNPCSEGATCTSDYDSLSYVCTCPPGKTGQTCNDFIDYCADNPCSEGATCTSDYDSLSYVCTCPPGKTGQTCNDFIDYCADNPCSEGATCTSDYDALSYSCACPPGKTGQTCNDFIDYCANNPCSEGATCTSDYDSLSYVCTCPPGKTGQTCNENINYCANDPCSEGATCNNDYDLLSYVCSCPPGKTGQTCNDLIDYCASDPCSEGATCTNDYNLLHYVCYCPPGRTGQTCNELIDYCASDPCSEGATCTNDYDLLSYVCSCPPGRTGQICNGFINYCANDPCSEGATCNNDYDLLSYTCSCPPGKTGPTCNDFINYCADDPCFEEATCTSDYNLLHYVCSCPPGRTGQTCNDLIDYCASDPCSEGATCTNDYDALSYVCSCPPGRTGRICNGFINYCANDPCFEGATCNNDYDSLSYVCSCPPGRTGQTCDDDIDHCSSNPCSEGATCINDRLGRTFQCSCPSDRTGRTCETILPPISLEFDSNQAGLESEDTSNGGSFPYLYVVYAVLGVAFIVVIASVLAVVLYKKVYVPYKMRRSVRRATPFDTSNMDETKHYNPMYLGSDTFEGDGISQTEDNQYETPLAPAQVASLSFSNPMYDDVEDNLELMAEEEEESHPYELIDQETDGDNMPNNSDGVYEEPDVIQDVTDGDGDASDGAEKTTVLKNIYDTLERSNGSIVFERKGESGSPLEEPDFFSGVDGGPKIPSIYDTLKDDN